MKTLNKIYAVPALIAICLPLSSLAVSINGSYQSVTTNQQNDMKQENGKRDTQALNNLRIDATTASLQWQTVEARKETTMRQNGGKNSIQALNNAVVKKNTIVVQKADLQKLKMYQKGGKGGNVQAVNNLHIKR